MTIPAQFDAHRNIISSPALEALLTSHVFSDRLLYSNHIWSGPNNLLVQITVNNAEIAPDLVNRSLPINLDYDGPNPMGRKFSISDIDKFVADNIDQIRAELLGMIVKWLKSWKESGEPKYAAAIPRCPSRFREWQRTIGGILEANGFDGFMHNMADTMEKADVGVQHLKQLIAVFYQTQKLDPDTSSSPQTHFLQFRDAAELCFENPEWFGGLRGRGTQGIATKLGGIMKEYYGKEFEVELSNGRRILVRVEKGLSNNRRGLQIVELPSAYHRTEALTTTA